MPKSTVTTRNSSPRLAGGKPTRKVSPCFASAWLMNVMFTRYVAPT